MTRTHLFTTTILSGLLVAGLFGSAALAEDAAATMPAVSAFNGRIELGGGYADVDGFSDNGTYFGAGAITVPLADAWGLQADFTARQIFDETALGGTLHLFTRDPDSYLLGAIGGYSWIDSGSGDNATAGYVGGEAELYLDNISLEMAAGYIDVSPDSTITGNLFAFGDIAIYPVENLRLAVGASSVAGVEEAHIAGEYLIEGSPFSFNVVGTLGEDNFSSATAGLTFHFGGDDPGKSLMRRHREDDPKVRFLNVFGAGATSAGAVTCEYNPGLYSTPETSGPQLYWGPPGCTMPPT